MTQMLSRLAAFALLAGMCLSAHAFRAGTAVQEDAFPEDGEVDHRGNVIAGAVAETLWAVRVLRAGTRPNNQLPPWAGRWATGSTNMDLLWAWIQAMQENDQGGIPFRLDPPMDEEAEKRNTQPESFIGAIFVGHKFKNGVDRKRRPVYGMDYYINSRLENRKVTVMRPTGKEDVMYKVDDRVRSHFFFAERGRTDVPNEYIRRNSFLNNHAGIAGLAHMPLEAVAFFGNLVLSHAKSFVARDDDEAGARNARELGAPFIGGASGSIEYMVHSMEDTCLSKCRGGLVPCEGGCQVREALLGIMAAALIAGGQHSLLECLEVMQAMGYFTNVAPVATGGDYLKSVHQFEEYLGTLGVGVGSDECRPLVVLAEESGRATAGEKTSACFEDMFDKEFWSK